MSLVKFKFPAQTVRLFSRLCVNTTNYFFSFNTFLCQEFSPLIYTQFHLHLVISKMTDKIHYELIRKKFLSCSKISNFDLPQKLEINEQIVLYNATVGDPMVLEYPVKYKYQQKFVKELVEMLERENEEIYELFYEKLVDLLSRSEFSTHYRHFLMENGKIDRLIIEESQSLISGGTTGLCSWQGASVLAEWCINNKHQLSNKKILELGSGVGLTGLTVMNSCSPKKFIFSDCHPKVLNLLRSNVDRNFLEFRDSYEVLDLSWEDVDEALGSNLNPDLVIAADIIYDDSLFPALISALRIFLRMENCFGIIAITVRNEETVTQFFRQLENEEFDYKEMDLPKCRIFFETDKTPVKIIKLIYKKKT